MAHRHSYGWHILVAPDGTTMAAFCDLTDEIAFNKVKTIAPSAAA